MLWDFFGDVVLPVALIILLIGVVVVMVRAVMDSF